MGREEGSATTSSAIPSRTTPLRRCPARSDPFARHTQRAVGSRFASYSTDTSPRAGLRARASLSMWTLDSSSPLASFRTITTASVQVDADVHSLHRDLLPASFGRCFGQPECVDTRALTSQGDPLFPSCRLRHQRPPREHPARPHHDDRSRESGDPLLHRITSAVHGINASTADYVLPHELARVT